MIEWHNYNCTPNVLFDTNNTSYILVLWFFFVEMYFTDIIIIFVRLLKPFSPTCVHVRKTYTLLKKPQLNNGNLGNGISTRLAL